MGHVLCQMYECCSQFNNIATKIFQQSVCYFATERDDGRYVTVLEMNEMTTARCVFILRTV